ncbi:polymerization and export protein [Lactobacillus acidophilus]|uniref:polymerization and export protein n=1 Tax=Lactobacillus acidophilus TaxID=1579 RepID=UPI0021A5C755|nr:polymerization and export protein [Lactobacillus acidophilus]MCT3602863.1 polymerization and export protein [Lactobacillus acidophilus]MCT3623323.1 polymerization and export protein [Lactobacillus acidophilus]
MKTKKIYNYRVNKLLNLLSYIIAIIIIFNCNTVYISSSNFTLIQKLQFPLLICVSWIYVFIRAKISHIYIDRSFILGIVVSVYLSLFLFFRTSNSTIFSNFKLIITFFTIFSLVWSEKSVTHLSRILKAYVNIITVIAAVSIVFWVMGSWLHFINYSSSVMLTWGDPQRIIPSYYNLYFETQYINGITRNSAIFVEAPMAALNFLIALSLNVLLEKQIKLNNIKNLIIIIAGILTMSTTMYVGIIILIVYRITRPTYKNKFVTMLKPILFIIFVPILFLIVNRLIGGKLDTQSGIDRKLDYVNAFSAWSNHPLFGNGIDAGVNEGLTRINGTLVAHYGFSSSFTKILGDGGFYLLILVLISVIASVNHAVKSKNWSMLTFVLIIIYLFLVTIFAQTYIMFYLFIFIALWNPDELIENRLKYRR